MKTKDLVPLLFFLKGILWSILAFVYLLRGHSAIIYLLLIGDAGIHLYIAWAIRKHGRRMYQFGLFFIIINLILTLTDQMGVWDFAVLVIYGLILLVMGVDWRKQS